MVDSADAFKEGILAERAANSLMLIGSALFSFRKC